MSPTHFLAENREEAESDAKPAGGFGAIAGSLGTSGPSCRGIVSSLMGLRRERLYLLSLLWKT